MIPAIVSEYRKFFSTRMWWILTLCMAVFFVAVSFGMAWLFAYQATHNGLSDSMLQALQPTVYGLGPSMGYIIPVIIGAFAVTSEYRHNTIVPTFLAEPRRWVVMLAKVVAGVPMGVAVGIAGTLACLVGGGLGFTTGGVDPMLWTSTMWTNFALSILAYVIWALIGVGLGMLITSQVGVIITVLAFTQLIEPLANIALNQFAGASVLAKFLPAAASGSVTGGTDIYAMMSMTGTDGALGVWQGAAVLAAYGIVFGVLGYVLRIRRDVS
ncbi:MAG: hypothetical protein FWD75_04245 [Propionibacteriaceae bacterium]|nr:hypothetical protein [Propionibacteriaceae bacterium]